MQMRDCTVGMCIMERLHRKESGGMERELQRNEKDIANPRADDAMSYIDMDVHVRQNLHVFI